ncbi:MAG: T9SS type B sorting domain-containing protein, partial [Ferruginibacter sp.]
NAVVTSTTNVTICTSQLPYSWNGNSYPAAGTYSVTLTSSGGCDSIATLILTANAVVTSTTNVTICTSQLPYSWNGNSYPAGGTYSVTLTSSGGCDSIATLNLTANTVVTSTTNITICNNQLPYSWNGNSYPAAGTYSVTLTSSGGCDSIATLNLTSNAVVTSTTNLTICTEWLPYSWNGNSYPAAGTYSVTLTSNAGCDSIATLNLTVNPVPTSTTNIAICSNQLPYSWNGNSYPAAGTYSVTLVSNANCDSIVTLNLAVNPTVTSTTNITICNNQLPYSWNGNSYPAAGTYSVTLTSSSGCDSIATLNLMANAVVTSNTAITICTSQLPYSWNGNSYPAAGTYNVTLVSSAGCDSIATLNLTANAVVTSTTNITICNSQLPYSWNGNSYPTAGTYLVTLTSSGGCDSIATLQLAANPVVTSSTNVSICNNQLPYSWNSNNYPAAGTYSVTLVSTAGCDSIATLNLTVNSVVTSTTALTICNNQLPYSWNGNSYPAAGSYNITLASSGGCDSIATLNLTVNPVVTSTTNTTICTSQLPYSWNGNSYPAAGSFNVTLVSTAGCDSIATLNLVANAILTSTTNINVCSNQLPYNWNGNSYPVAGNYSVTLTSSGGCDSVATLQLISNAVVTSNTNTAICNTQLPYNWNGNNYPVAGTYPVTLVSSAGCDSVATLHLIVNNASTSTTNTTICSSQLPYSWNGQSYAAGGTHIVTLVNAAGCDSVATLNLAVNISTTSSTPASTCSNQLPYSWNGQNYSTAGSHTVTLVNAAGCDSVATLVLTINPVPTSNTPANTCTNQLPYSWNGQSYSTAGTHTVTLTSSAGCDSIATLQLTIHPVVTSTTNESTCDNQFPYSWNGNNYPAAGTYVVTLTSTAGCDSIATLHLASNAVTTSLTSVTVCSGALPYSWNGQNYSTGGVHAVTLTGSSNCDSVASLNLSINPTPALPAVGAPITYCQQDATAQLTATVTTTGSQLLWYISPAGGAGASTAPTPSSSTAGSITYYVSQVNGSCEGPRALITVTVNSKPDLGDQVVKICTGQTANIATLYNTTGLTSNWTFNQQPVTDPTIVNEAGSYQLIASNATGCIDTAIVVLTINPPVTANAGPDGNAEPNQPYQLTGSGGGEYQWSPSQGLNNVFIANPLATIEHDQTYILLVKDDIGCFALDTVNLRVLNGPTFYVPSAFTPNGDGLNDFFRPTFVGIQSLDYFAVFNRYGEKVFEMTDLSSKGWDGTYKGKRQPIDNYVWQLKGVDRTGAVKIMRGNCVLIR